MTHDPAIPVLDRDGSRMIPRPFTQDDVPAVCALLSTPDIAATTLNVAFPYPERAAVGWIATHAGQARYGAGYVWAITLAHDRRVIGTISMGIIRKHARGTLGYWLGIEYWNQGI